MSGKRVYSEEFEIHGDKLVGKIKELLHAGNIRRITIKDEHGHALIEIPLTIGVVVGVVAAVLAAVGAIAALSTKCVIAIERVEEGA
jgi:hypothetical protein